MEEHQDNIIKLGEVIRTARHDHGDTVRSLAERVGVHHSSITRLERGEFARPTPYFLRSLASALDLPLTDLYHLAGLTLPEDLPDFGVYLRTRHSLPRPAVEELTGYFNYVRDKYGLDPNGPAPGEDEQDETDNLIGAA